MSGRFFCYLFDVNSPSAPVVWAGKIQDVFKGLSAVL